MSKYVLVADITQLPGSLTIGDDPASDTLTVNATVASDIIPDGDLNRKLGSPSAQWKVYGTVTDGITENFSQAFEHPLSGSNEYFTVWTYTAADYVGGTMKVYVKKKSSNNYGIAEYLFLNNTSGATIEIEGRDHLGTQTINNNQNATVVASGGGDYVELEIQTDSGAGGNGDVLEVKVTVELIKA